MEDMLEAMTRVRPEVLNDETLRLFNQIMALIDERDELKQENQQLKIQVSAREEVVNQLQDRINMAKEYITKQLEQNEWEYYGRRILLEILGDNND